MDEYMKSILVYVCQNGGKVELTHLHQSGITAPVNPKMKLKRKFELYGTKYFNVRTVGTSCYIEAVLNRNTIDTKKFKIANGTVCHYASKNCNLDEFLRSLDDESTFISIDCKGAPNDLQLTQIATEGAVYIFDFQLLDKEKVCNALKPILSAKSPLKLMHGVHKNAVALKNFGGIELVGVVDTQLIAEYLCGNPFTGQNEFLCHLNLPQHPNKGFVHGMMNSGKDLWNKRPISQTNLECAAMDVNVLQIMAKEIPKLVTKDTMEKLIRASLSRVKSAVQHDGARSICFDTKNDFAVSSAELIRSFRPQEGFFGEKLVVESNVDEIFTLLPLVYKSKLVETRKKQEETVDGSKQEILPIESLTDIVLDIGRRANCWIRDTRFFLCDDEFKLVDRHEIDHITSKLGKFGSDNRAGLDRQLHRISAMRDRENCIMGITIRVGRNVRGNAAMLMDLLMSSNKSILILGEPGSGKTTIVREAARILAEKRNVIVVDTSNEIAGDGTTPNRCIGEARRMMVPALDKQSSVMVECVQNHTPHVMVIDEIGRPKEVQAARTVKQRGVRIVASAHGTLRSLLKNKDLVGLLGGIERVTIGDKQAKEEAELKRSLIVSKTKVQRCGDPTFEIVVEVCREAHNDWKIICDSAEAVDKVLDGLQYKSELRMRDPETGDIRMEFVQG